MAVPKKRKSKSKSSSRKHIWNRQIVKEAARAISLAKAILGGHTKFVRINPGAMFQAVPNPARKVVRRKRIRPTRR